MSESISISRGVQQVWRQAEFSLWADPSRRDQVLVTLKVEGFDATLFVTRDGVDAIREACVEFLAATAVCSCVASERDADGNRDPVPTGECEVHG